MINNKNKNELKKQENDISFWRVPIPPNGTSRWDLQSAKSCSLLLVRKSNQHVRLWRQLQLWLYYHRRDALLNAHLPGRIHGLLNLLHLERRIRQEARSEVNPSSMDTLQHLSDHSKSTFLLWPTLILPISMFFLKIVPLQCLTVLSDKDWNTYYPILKRC